MKEKEDDKFFMTKRFYDKYNFTFSDQTRTKIKLEKRLIGSFLKKYCKGKNIKVLDVGCGTGDISYMIMSRFGIKTLGIDISNESLKIAKKRGLRVKQASNMDLPFHDNYADIVISNGVIHHTPDAFKSFSELVRVTKKKGKIFLSVYNRHGPYYFIYKCIGGTARFFRRNNMEAFNRHILYRLWKISRFDKLLLGKKINDDTRWSLFNDQLLSPVASFHTEKEIKAWSEKLNVKIIESRKENFCFTLNFILEKQ